MNEEERLRLINEIKAAERDLYLKRSKLAAAELMEGPDDVGNDKKTWKREFDDLIRRIGQLSTGGNSVEDVRRERDGIC